MDLRYNLWASYCKLACFILDASKFTERLIMYAIRYDEPENRILYYKSHLEPSFPREKGTTNGLTIAWTIRLGDARLFRSRQEAEERCNDICFGKVIEIKTERK